MAILTPVIILSIIWVICITIAILDTVITNRRIKAFIDMPLPIMLDAMATPKLLHMWYLLTFRNPLQLYPPEARPYFKRKRDASL